MVPLPRKGSQSKQSKNRGNYSNKSILTSQKVTSWVDEKLDALLALNCTIHGIEIKLFGHIINSQIMADENCLLTCLLGRLKIWVFKWEENESFDF